MTSKYVYSIPWRERMLFLKLFAKWKGSVWQLLWIDITIYFLLHMGISFIYRFLLTAENGYGYQRRKFEEFVEYVKNISDVVPLSFLLGFFVTLIVGRWWNVCMTIPWMNKPSIMIHSMLTKPGDGKGPEENEDHKPYTNNAMQDESEEIEKTKQIRLLILRYMNLAIAICLRANSIQIRKRFALKKLNLMDQVGKQVIKARDTLIGPSKKEIPTIQEKLEIFNKDEEVKKTFGKLITEEEIEAFEEIAKRYHHHDPAPPRKLNDEVDGSEFNVYEPEYWIPLQWAMRVMTRANELGFVSNDRHYMRALKAIEELRGILQTLQIYGTYNIPLVYIQVVIIAVYSYFIGELFSHQYVDSRNVSKAIKIGKPITFDTYIPVFSLLKFIFYVGWFKIGYSLLDPLGEDSEDFPVSEIFTYNLEVSIRSGSAPDFLYPKFLLEKTNLSNPLLDKINEAVKTQDTVNNSAETGAEQADIVGTSIGLQKLGDHSYIPVKSEVEIITETEQL